MIKGAIDDALQDIPIDYRTTIDNFSSQIHSMSMTRR